MKELPLCSGGLQGTKEKEKRVMIVHSENKIVVVWFNLGGSLIIINHIYQREEGREKLNHCFNKLRMHQSSVDYMNSFGAVFVHVAVMFQMCQVLQAMTEGS